MTEYSQKTILALVIAIALTLLIIGHSQICSAATLTYTYDNLNRLTRVDYGNGAYIQYTYDEVGNRTSMVSYRGNMRTPSIWDSKAAADNTDIAINGTRGLSASGACVVTAAFNGVYYIEADDRSCGMRVHRANHGVSPGMRVTVEGTMKTTSDGERYIDADEPVLAGAGSISPVFLTGRNVGGAGWRFSEGSGAGQRGVKGGTGLNTVGLLVRITGRTSYVDPGGQYFVVNDGSALQDPDGHAGVRVWALGLSLPPVGDIAEVTGIVSMKKQGQDYYPLILARQQSDITQIATGSVSGRVTNQSGQPVAGVTITLSPSGKSAVTNSNGNYTITALSSGHYTATPSQIGYSFAPSTASVTITNGAPVAGVNFVRGSASCSISGSVMQRAFQQTAQVIESPHPYTVNYTDTRTISGPGNAIAMRVHFTLVNLEAGYDFLRIKNGSGALIQTYDQYFYINTWSDWVTGSTVKVELTSDESACFYGYQIDRYQAAVDTGGAQGVLLTATPGGATTTTGSDGLYTLNVPSPGSYTATPSQPGYAFSPVSISATAPASGVNFARYPVSGISGTVTAGSIQETSTTVQSPHPYTNDYSNTWTVTGPSGAIAIRVRFAQIGISTICDYIYVADSLGRILQDMNPNRYGSLSNVWSDWVPGNSLQIRFLTDWMGTDYGFRVDSYQAQMPSAGAQGVTLTLNPGTVITSTGPSGSYTFGGLGLNAYTITPSQSGYTFESIQRAVTTELGPTITGVDFLRK